MGAGSSLGNLARRKENLRRQAKALSEGAARGAPQAPTRANPQPPPPPRAPAQAAPPARGAPAPAAAEGQQRPSPGDRRARAERFLQEVGSQMQGQVPPPEEGRIRDASIRQDITTTLQDRLVQLGASERSLETQFFRLAGRMGSPREVSLLASRLELERQLNRPPTQGEFQNFIAKPGSLGPLFSPAVERTRPQEAIREG